MDTADGVAAIIEAARETGDVLELKDGRQVIVTTSPGARVHEVAKPVHPPLPTRLVIGRTFHEGDSFGRYVARYKQSGTQLIANLNTAQVVALIDYPDEDQASGEVALAAVGGIPAREHMARWTLPYSEAFAAWNKHNGKMLEQTDFLAFLEENVGDVMRPDPARILELVKDFAAVKTTSFQSSRRLDNGDRSLQYVTETNTKAGIEIPQRLYFKMPIYLGEEEVEFSAWFRTRIDAGALYLGIEFHRIEPIKQAAFRQAVTRIAEIAGLDPQYGEI